MADHAAPERLPGGGVAGGRGDDFERLKALLEDPPTIDPATPPSPVAGKDKQRKNRSTKTQHRPGVLRLKEYPITEDTLDNIGTLRVSAAFWFAVGSLALGFALGSIPALVMAPKDVPTTAFAVSCSLAIMAGVVAVVAYGAGTFYYKKGQSVVQFVKDSTVHDPID